MQGGEPNMWTGLANLRNGQVQRRWQRVQMLLVFNTIAAPIVAGTTEIQVKVIVSNLAYLVHLALIMAAWRGERLLHFWTSKLAELEMLDQNVRSGDKRVRVQVFSSVEYAILRGDANKVSSLNLFIGIVVVLIWAAFAARFNMQFLR